MYESIKAFSERTGVIAEGTVLINFDDPSQVEILIEDLQVNCRVCQTPRGKHFLFTDKEGW